jgi:hypothetical protein
MKDITDLSHLIFDQRNVFSLIILYLKQSKFHLTLKLQYIDSNKSNPTLAYRVFKLYP